MNPVALANAALIAIAGTGGFLLMAWSCARLAGAFSGRSRFSDRILNEAAEGLRCRIERLGRVQTLQFFSALAFAVLFVGAYLLQPRQIIDSESGWRIALLLGAAAALTLMALFRIIGLQIRRNRLRYQRDASIAVGHCLQQLCGNQNRLFHDVPGHFGAIDHVIAGLHGIHAVFVVARRPRRDRRVRLNGDQLAFAPGNVVISVADFGRKAERLARECGKVASQQIRVRPVIAVPGWEVDAQSSADFLVVNECNLAMIGGWKDESDYLLNEDVGVIQRLLAGRCARPSGSAVRD